MDKNASPGEQMLLVIVGTVVAGSIVSLATWHRVIDFLVDRQILLPASTDPLLPVPAANRAGLDVARLAILVAGLAIVVVFGASEIRRRSRVGQEES